MFLDDARKYPLVFFVGLCIFLTPVFGASINSLSSTVLALLFLIALFHVKYWALWFVDLSVYERYVLFGFFLFTLSGLISYYNALDDYEYVKQMGRYLRFTLIIPVYLLLVKHDIKIYKYLRLGVIVSGPVFLLIAIFSILKMDGVFGDRAYGAQGAYYQIIFGCIASLNALLMIVYLYFEDATRKTKMIIIFSACCALYTSFLSMTRTSWVAIVVCISLIFVMLLKSGRINLKQVFISLAILIAIIIVFPKVDIIQKRIDQAVDNISLFVSGEKYKSSSGDRIAFWHMAVKIWEKHPIIGTGLGDFDEEVDMLKAGGMYKSVPTHSNTHSIYFQGLATTGSVGLLATIFALIVFPLMLFIDKMKAGATVVGVSGIVFVISFAIFGITESWTLRAPFMSIYLAYFVALNSTAGLTGQINGESGVNST